MSPKPKDAATSAAEIVEERVKLHHDDNHREAIAGFTEAEEGDALSDKAREAEPGSES